MRKVTHNIPEIKDFTEAATKVTTYSRKKIANTLEGASKLLLNVAIIIGNKKLEVNKDLDK